MMIIDKLARAGLVHPPRWLPNNVMFLAYTGSVAYGASADTSDMDCHGFCIPPKSLVFPHLDGEIMGFGRQKQRFRVWQQHGIAAPDGRKTYDFNVYNIVDFVHLAMEANPNVIELLFLPRRCVLHTTEVAENLRANRRLFLHKGAMHKLRGYAFSQLAKIEGKTNSSNPKRAATIAEHGYDTKFGYHVVRLCLQAEQILAEHDLDLERNAEILKSVRRGEWSIERLKEWFENKERGLEELYAKSDLQAKPDEDAIKAVLIECLQMHYGSVSDGLRLPDATERLVAGLRDLLARYDGAVVPAQHASG